MGTWEGHLETENQHAQGHVCILFLPVSVQKTHVASPLCGAGSCGSCWKQYSWTSLHLSDRGSSRAHTELWPHFYNSCGKSHLRLLSLCLSLSACVRKGSRGHPSFLSSWLYWKMRENSLDWCLQSSVRKIALQFISWGLTSRKIAKPCGAHFQETYSVWEVPECPKCWGNWWYHSEIRECRGAVILK